MTYVNILRFNLIAPIHYLPLTDADPFGYAEENGENLFCFELDESQRLSFEPDTEALLGALTFGGKAAGDVAEKAAKELPCGHYLFAQKRDLLCRDEILAMAVEVQKEGLWQRLKLGEKLYLRYLYEDGCVVTQLYRPYAE